MIRLRTLGTLDLRPDDGAELRAVLAQPRRLALLAYLGVAAPRGFHRRDQLLAVFWADQDEERARASLNRACYFLRKELGDGVLLSRGGEEIGLSDERFWCDASAFGVLLERGQLSDALDLFRGDLLPGFYASNAQAFEAWLERERARLRDRAAEAAWALADREEATGNHAGAAQWARRGVELAPFTEAGVRKLLTLLDRAGDRAAAAHAYDRFAARIDTELELSPSPETRRLIESIRARARIPASGGEAPVLPFAEESGASPQPRRVDMSATHSEDASRASTSGAMPRAPEGGSAARDAPALGTVATARSRPLRRHAMTLTTLGARQLRRRATVLTTLVVLPLALVALVSVRGRRPEIDASLVAVERFRNGTGEPGIDLLGREAASRIAAALAQAGVAKTVVQVGQTTGGRWRAAWDAVVQSVSRTQRTHPAVVVSGAFMRQGDSLSLQTWITDGRRGGAVWRVRPVTIAAGSPASSIDEVRQRAVGGVAALGNPGFASYIQTATSPPTFEAYQEFSEGNALEARGAFEEALRHYRWAAALDTTFTWPLVTGALASLSRGTGEQTDSMLRAVTTVRHRLPPLQRHLVDYMFAVRAENWLAAHDAIQRAARLVPERYSYLLAVRATHLNRPREAVEALTQRGMDSVFRDAVQSYWLVLTLSLHQLGEHRTELAAARHARQNRPQSASALAQEVRALAALGRVDAVRLRLDTVLALPRDGWFTPAEAFVSAGLELRAHGHAEAAEAAFARAIAWHRGRPDAERSSDLRRWQLGNALYAAGDWDEADTVFRALAAAHPDLPDYIGPLGTIAARRGDRALAESYAEKLSHIEHFAPVPGQDAILWRAKIAALLGEPDRSMRLLIDAFGDYGTAQLHADADFTRLEQYAAFREFVRPKG